VWNLVSIRLETMLLSVQYKSRVCGERTIGSEIILDATDGSPKWVGHVESCFGPFGDSVSDAAI
jgi:hypothetical protein